MADANPLSLSDEDFLKLNDPSALAGASDDNGPDDASTLAATPPTATDPAPASPGSSEAEPAAADPAPAAETPPADQAGGGAVATPEGGAADPAGVADGGAKPAGETDKPASETTAGEAPAGDKPAGAEAAGEPVAPIKPEDAQAFYQQIMAPFKANGKMIQLKDGEEVIRLMQLGANYGRRMQELAPHRKTLMMLQNNDLLDPAKLSFLIDLDKGDPEAIKKFIKDRGIDPLDIDTSTDPAYLGGTHQVSDQQVAFTSALEELSSTPGGSETLAVINDKWDTASKEQLWQHPEILSVIQQQRELGIYDVITAEIDRQVMLGKLAPTVPFLEAYKTVGDQLVAEQQGTQGQAPAAPAPTPAAQPQVLATRVETPKSPVTASDQVAAATPSRGTAPQPKNTNPQAFFAMSDEEFMKLDRFQGRI